MKIHEYQAKDIFARYGIPIPPGKVATTVDEAGAIGKEIGYPIVIKAQVHVGGRGKAGGVKLANNDAELKQHAGNIIGMDIKGFEVKKVLVARALDIESEAYLGMIVDRTSKKVVVMVSKEGGVEIEETAKKNPGAINKTLVGPLVGLLRHQASQIGFFLYTDPKHVSACADITMKLYKLFAELDCSLAEINPLIVTKDKRVVALDAKINFDDNGLMKHPELEPLRDPESENENEVKAREAGLSYVQLAGNIGCVVNGAGLAMATMDIVKHYGGEPANFLDIGGSSSPQKVKEALSILLKDPNVRVIFFNIFGGITRCDDVAQGILDAKQDLNIKQPFVVRLTGTNEDKAKQLLKNAGLIFADSMAAGAQKSIEMVK